MMTARTAASIRRAKGVYFVLVAFSLPLLLCDACGGPPPGTGDPGNHRLAQLRADPVFASLPPGAQLQGEVKELPAKWRAPAFEPPGWDGPAVEMTFVDGQPPSTIFAFYTAQATAAGWVSNGNQNRDGYPEDWTKTFPGGWQGWLSLIDMTSTKSGQVHIYALNAGGAAIDVSG